MRHVDTISSQRNSFDQSTSRPTAFSLKGGNTLKRTDSAVHSKTPARPSVDKTPELWAKFQKNLGVMRENISQIPLRDYREVHDIRHALVHIIFNNGGGNMTFQPFFENGKKTGLYVTNNGAFYNNQPVLDYSFPDFDRASGASTTAADHLTGNPWKPLPGSPPAYYPVPNAGAVG